jgi:hypothetical protein
MPSLLVARIRRHWQPWVAAAVGILFVLAHLGVYLPLKARLSTAETRARGLGVAFDPDAPPETMPPRVVALIAGNTMAPQEAMTRSTSGALTADLFDAIAAAANQAGVNLIATDPGITVQQEQWVQVKAHVRATCNFSQFLRMLDALARGDQLISVERFSLVEGSGNRLQLELWLSRLVLKRSGERQ